MTHMRSMRMAAGLALVMAAGCDILGPKKDDVGTFLTLAGKAASPPTTFFDGPVTRDAAGCYRTTHPDPTTVIWPAGAYAESDGTRIVVHEATGRPAGEVPGHFQLMGHHLTDLQGQPMSADTRSSATATCPGRYLVVEDFVELALAGAVQAP